MADAPKVENKPTTTQPAAPTTSLPQKSSKGEGVKGSSVPYARYEFKIMNGSSQGQDYTQPPIEDTLGNIRQDRRRPSKIYRTGEHQWSNTDLASVHNKQMSQKFKLVKDYGEGAYTDGIKPEVKGPPNPHKDEFKDGRISEKELQGMSVGELRRYAADSDIDVTGCHNKHDLVTRIRSVESAA